MPSSLDEALVELRALCDAERSPVVDDLRQRLAQGQLRVLLVGEAKRGKSTLGNALLGREILPTGVIPVTAVATVLTAGTPERVDVTFRDGRTEQVGLAALPDYVTEDGNPANARGVGQVSVVVSEGLPAPDLRLVDTPGVGSVLSHNTAEARSALDRMDLAVFVLTADPPMSASEAALLAEVQGRAVATFVVLNKADRLTPAELVEALGFLDSVLPGTQILACSARAGLAGRLRADDDAYQASGVGAVADAITGRLATRGREDLRTSVAVAARRVATALGDETAVTLAALAALATSRHDQAVAFRDRLSRLPAEASDAQSRIRWRTSALQHSLTEDAAARASFLARQARAEVDRLAAQPGHDGAQGLRARAGDAVRALVRAGVTGWQEEWAGRLRDHLDHLVAQEESHLQEAASAVRDAAERDLGVRLSTDPIVLPRPAASRFQFDFADPVGWDAPLAEQFRRHAPGALARRRIVTALRRRAVDLPDKHLGRARFDVQERLAQAERALSAAVAQAYADLGDGLTRALDAATAAGALTAAALTTTRRQLEERQSALAALTDVFDNVAVPA